MKLWSSQQIPRFREIAEISLRHLSPTKVGGGTLAHFGVGAGSGCQREGVGERKDTQDTLGMKVFCFRVKFLECF